MRCFLAVDVEGRLMEKIANLQKGVPGDVKLVEKENLHYTLKFLGETDEKILEVVKDRVKDLAKSLQELTVCVKGMGAFPGLNYIRVVWLGGKELFNLQKAVDDRLADLFGKEKEITPHLTLARVRSAAGKEELKSYIEKHAETEIGDMPVKEIKLKKSTLSPKGPVYEDLYAFKLAKA